MLAKRNARPEEFGLSAEDVHRLSAIEDRLSNTTSYASWLGGAALALSFYWTSIGIPKSISDLLLLAAILVFGGGIVGFMTMFVAMIIVMQGVRLVFPGFRKLDEFKEAQLCCSRSYLSASREYWDRMEDTEAVKELILLFGRNLILVQIEDGFGVDNLDFTIEEQSQEKIVRFVPNRRGQIGIQYDDIDRFAADVGARQGVLISPGGVQTMELRAAARRKGLEVRGLEYLVSLAEKSEDHGYGK